MKKKKWFRIPAFLLALFTIGQIISFTAVQRSHRKNGYYWPHFYNELPENSVDIVIMGNSHANTTFIPEIFDDILGWETIHVNTSGESIYQTYFEYQEVLRRQNPEVVIIETFPIYAGRYRGELLLWNFSFF